MATVGALFTGLGLLLPIFALQRELPWLLGFYLICALGAEPYVLTMCMASAIGVRLFFSRSVRIHPLRVPYDIGLVAATTLWLLVCYGSAVSLLRGNSGRMFTEAAQYVFAGILVLATSWSCCSAANLRKPLAALALGAFALSAIKVLSTLGLVEWETSGFISTIDNNYSAAYILVGGVVAPLLLMPSATRRTRYALAMIWALSIAAIDLNRSRSNMLMAMVLSGLWWLRAKPSRAGFRTVLVIVLALTYIAVRSTSPASSGSVWSMFTSAGSHSNLVRAQLLALSWDTLLSNPFGMGIGATNDLFAAEPILGEVVPHPHNTIAQLGVELGVIGAATGLLALFWLLFVFASELPRTHSRSLQGEIRTMFAPYLAAWFLYESVVFNGPVMMMYMVILGMLLGAMRQEQSQT